MQLEKVTAEIRPRGRWESIDLGCALVRENFGKVMNAWFLTVIPLWFVIISLCQLIPNAEAAAWLAGLFCLWTLPFCDRIPLFILSRRLFGDDPSWMELWKSLPGILSRRFFLTLVLGPMNLGRGLSQPVVQLEGLKGKAYRERVRLLSRNGGEGASQASMISLLLVLATMFSMLFIFFTMVGLFGDEIVIEEFWVDHVLGSNATFMPAPYVWILVGLMLSAITMIEPFCVGAGFAMYINSRTITEGWDIELAFKRMSERVNGLVQTSGKVLVLLFAIGLTWGEALASNERLDQVMEHDDFIVHTEIVDVAVETDNGSWFDFMENWQLAGIGVIATLIFYLVIIALVVGLVWLIYANRHVFAGANIPQSGGESSRRVSSVMGMVVSPESLPDDIAQAAREAWIAGQHHQALSLLYRGSISALIHQDEVQIESSDTESDCLRAVTGKVTAEREQYFSTLTKVWMGLAYGNVMPHDATAASMIQEWPFGKEGES